MAWRLTKRTRVGTVKTIGRSYCLRNLVAILSLILMANVWMVSFGPVGTGTSGSDFKCVKERRNEVEHIQDSNSLFEDPSKCFACSQDNTQVFDKDKAIVLGKPFKDKVFLTVGIPTIERKYKNQSASYIEKTLGSLIQNIDIQDRGTIRFIVFLSDAAKKSRDRIKTILRRSFHNDIEQGIVQVIEAPDTFYPQLVGLKRTYGDSPERLYWRSKQTMDYVFLFRYAHELSQYYLQMEDDVTTVANYSSAIKEFIKAKEGKPWVMLEFCGWGFIGKLFRNSSLIHFARFLELFYNDSPCDWLLWTFLRFMGNTEGALSYFTTLEDSLLPWEPDYFGLKDTFVLQLNFNTARVRYVGYNL